MFIHYSVGLTDFSSFFSSNFSFLFPFLLLFKLYFIELDGIILKHFILLAIFCDSWYPNIDQKILKTERLYGVIVVFASFRIVCAGAHMYTFNYAPFRTKLKQKIETRKKHNSKMYSRVCMCRLCVSEYVCAVYVVWKAENLRWRLIDHRITLMISFKNDFPYELFYLFLSLSLYPSLSLALVRFFALFHTYIFIFKFTCVQFKIKILVAVAAAVYLVFWIIRLKWKNLYEGNYFFCFYFIACV